MDEEQVTTGTAPDTSPAPEAPATDTNSQTPEQTAQESEQRVPDAAIKVDPQTGKRSIVFPADEQAQQTQETQAQETQPPTAEQPQVQQYNSNDLVRLVAMGQPIDPARVPKELEGYAAAIQQQRVNAMQRMAQQVPQTPQQNVPPQPPQPTAEQIQAMQAQRANVYAEIERLAEKRASQELGMTREQVNDAKFSDDPKEQARAKSFEDAVSYNKQAIQSIILQNKQAQAQQAAAAQRETMETMQAIMPKYQEYQKDPHYNDIDVMMGDFYKTMPFEEGMKVKQSIDRFLAHRPVKADVDILDNYYKKTKEAYYAKLTGVGTTPQHVQRQTPPRVEKPGQNAPTPPTKTDWSQMRNMTPAQRSKFFMEHFR